MSTLKLYYMFYWNNLPRYFENFLPEFGIQNYNLRNDLLRLAAIKCEFGEINAKYQMQVHLVSRYGGQLNHMAEPIPDPVPSLVRWHDGNHYLTADGRAETDVQI